ncbi:hypothetical protein J8O29_003292 [Salmonella enterica]|uniref:Ead/Ea22-like family protein n=2 Tax=Salmonella enterica TaxID=28901 RepID=A0A5V5X2G0_SALET|nr:hypothetical protein [Salmonella enterica]EBK1949856.1 hypothetical protein [Salmonella enterica subsp. enterica serovar Infantis]EBK2457963.1 hypothetical protein [Salmonella enterica subsp. enterica serovar Virchow]EBS0520860.1 hypothetical protein [Salmonella enterica subsp. enterica serovar Bareilly]ECH9160456.1 hypothetical protein [Salmonella enterica subsp. enterica]EGZ4372159.1 hypothetical protein [Salmonella enterica subsp. enterica serovar Cerro]EIF2710394.1 hypothetical protein
MKEVTLIEMDGFLKGKCIPRDLKVNETNAEYLVRKFAEAEAKCAALAAENAALKKSDVEFNEYCRHECEDVGDTWVDDFTETPATDAFLAEVRASGVDAAIEHLHKKFGGTGHIGVSVMALEWLAQEIRKGGAA